MENNQIVSENIENIKDKLEKLNEESRSLKKLLPKKAIRRVLPQSLKDDEFRLIIENLSDSERSKEAKIAFLLAYESGLRIAEVKNLKKEHFQVEAKRIFVEKGKFSKDRVVPLPKTWKSNMIKYIPIKKGIRALEIQFVKARDKAGLNKKYHFHSLRHSFATNLLERGMPINQVQLLMGHSNIQATNVYVQANPIDALKKYEEVF